MNRRLALLFALLLCTGEALAGVTITRLGGGDYLVTVTETGASATTESTIAGLPLRGVIRAMICDLDSGTGTTLDPVIGDESDPASGSMKLQNGTAAALIYVQPTQPTPYYSSTGTLYLRAVVDAASDNATTCRILISGGWSS
jgi:hypothetical protein